MFQSKSFRDLVPRAALAALAMLASAPTVLLTACGGGGGGDDSLAPPASAAEITITEANQQAVAAEAVSVAQQGSEVADLGGSLVTAAQVDARSPVGDPLLLAAVARTVLALAPQGPAMAVGVTNTVTKDCAGGGTATLTESGSGSAVIGPGDTVSISANNCVDGVGGAPVRLHGRLTITVTAGSFAPDSLAYPKDVTLTMAADVFSVDALAIDGSVNLHLVQASANSGTVTLSSPSFTWRDSGSGSRTVSLADYLHRVDLAATGIRTTRVSGKVTTDSARINAGFVSFEMSTPIPIVSNPSGVITAGSVQVVGKASSLLLTTTASDTFSLQVDTDGNGTYDATRSVTRSQL